MSQDWKAISQAVEAVQDLSGDPRKGLPEGIFCLVSRLTPLVNVDLLIRNLENRTLLTWRNDSYHGTGWHLPGGIIRFQEKAADRVREVARNELGAEVTLESAPVLVSEIIELDRRTRGHFISLLFRCTLLVPPDPTLECSRGKPAPGQWRWHASCPTDLIRAHRIYEHFL
jgi:ADP-ribose pyrophosphatase YjhB (NUDIX family)